MTRKLSHHVKLRGAVAALAFLPLLLLPGCGGVKTKSDPLAEALAYFPPDTVLLVTINTDTESSQFKAIDEVGSKFPGWEGFKQELLDSLKQDKIDFEKDLKPWLGNEAVLGARSWKEIKGDNATWTVTLVAREEGTAKRFFKKLVDDGDMKEAGSYKEAQLYKDPADSSDEEDQFWALRGPVVLESETLDNIKSAIDVRESDKTANVEDFNRAVKGLPEDAIVRASVDVQAAIGSSDNPQTAEDARKVPWVAALSKLGIAANASPTEVGLKLRLGTDRRDLASDQLPFVADAQTPSLDVPADAILAVGLYDLEHLIRFAEGAAKAVQPAAHTSYRNSIAKLSQGLGLDIDRDFLGQLKGEMVLFFGKAGFGFTSSLQDAQEMKRVVDKLAPVVPGFLKGAGLPGVHTVKREGKAGTIYRLRRGGKTVATYGVVEDELVVVSGARDPQTVSTDATKKLESGAGALVTVADIGGFLDNLRPLIPLDEELQVIEPISTISGSVGNTTQALTADFEVNISSTDPMP